MRRLGFGIVGTGRIAETEIAPAIGRSSSAELVAVASRNLDTARAFAGRHDAASAYDDYEAMLADVGVDAVMIATPNALHAEQVEAAAAAGKHVLCDKPLATRGDDAARLVETCAAAGVTLGINFQTRHFTAFAEARQAIRSGAIGDVVLVEIEMSSGNTTHQSWRADPELAGLGTTFNIGVHGYDALRFLLDSEVAEVTAVTDVGSYGELERLVLAIFRFENGAIAYVNANQRVPDHRPDLTVYASAGRIVGSSVTRPNLSDGRLRVLSGGEETETVHGSGDAYDRVVEDFARAVLTGTQPLATGVDGLRSAEITDAIAVSARTGTTVRLERRSLQPLEMED